jgi:ATP-dependent RNA helicase SUPV3L1/SUV3
VTDASASTLDAAALDRLTGGAFTAPTASERAARVRDWLASEPSLEHLQEVYKELSAKDKGAAKPLREKLDELRRARAQDSLALDWAQRAQTLLAAPRINLADAMAWQRDAAKAGAPLSREPLQSLKGQLAERVKAIEDLQHKAQVYREASVLMTQRIEVLSTKPLSDALAQREGLQADWLRWQTDAQALLVAPDWASVDAKFAPMVQTCETQLKAVWEAFQAALSQAEAATADASLPMPPVPAWADQIRAQRGQEAPAAAQAPQRPKVDPAQRASAHAAVHSVLQVLEQELSLGHGKASAGAAQALRQALKEHGRFIDDKLQHHADQVLLAAGELEGWQRWRADQLRTELVQKAEALFKPAPPAAEGEEPAPPQPVMGGRKMQEALRQLREQWKQTDQGGLPNHGLWKRFDRACNQAHKMVEQWLEKVRADAAAHKAQRQALIEELQAWALAHAQGPDWKAVARQLHQFENRWRDAGHMSEKAFADVQNAWREAMKAARAPIDAVQQASVARRQGLIAEAEQLAAADVLRVDAVKALQQRWQAEAQTMVLERRLEQKLWDAFRKPIDDAFQRKTQQREQASAAMNEHDRAVLQAAKALEQANASADAAAIRTAMRQLEMAMRGQAQAAATPDAAVALAAPAASVETAAAASAASAASAAEPAETAATPDATQAPTDWDTTAPLEASVTDAAAQASGDDLSSEPAVETAAPEPTPAVVPVAPAPPPKKVVAVRGDDRPGMKKAEPAAPMGRGFKGRDSRDSRDSRDAPRGRPGDTGRGRDGFGAGGPRAAGPGRFERSDMGPRLGDAAFRAQRQAMEQAELALKKLAAQAHGETLTHVLTAWEKRDAELLPPASELGARLPPAQRSQWVKALSSPASAEAETALLRLEMAAELPSPAASLEARRQLQLVLLTRRNDAPPHQTWAQDAAHVMSSAYEPGQARRLQNALKVLLRR